MVQKSMFELVCEMYKQAQVEKFNLYATGFKWLQSTFAYDIIFARHLYFSTWFTKTLLFQEPKKT